MADEGTFAGLFENLQPFGGLDQLLSIVGPRPAGPGPAVSGGTLDLPQTPEDLTRGLAVLSHIESSNRYDAVGPETRHGRAYGRYQVLESNIGPWTEEVLGRRLTTEQFLADAQAQEEVARRKFGELWQQHGPAGAFRIWHGGPDTRQHGPQTQAYVARAMSLLGGEPMALGGPAAGPARAPAPRGGATAEDLVRRLLEPAPRPAAQSGTVGGLIDTFMGRPPASQTHEETTRMVAAARLQAAIEARPPRVSPADWQQGVQLVQQAWRRAVERTPDRNPQTIYANVLQSREMAQAVGLLRDEQAVLRMFSAMQRGLDPLTGLSPGMVGTDPTPTAQDYARTAVHPNLPENLRPGMMTRALGPVPESFTLGPNQVRRIPDPTAPGGFREVTGPHDPTETQARARVNVEEFNRLREAGRAASLRRTDIQELTRLSESIGEPGNFARVQQWALERGIPLGTTNEQEALMSLVQRLAPQLRVTGSGSTSDLEYRGMLNSLPQLWQRAGTRQRIIRMMRNVAEHQEEVGRIADEFLAGNITGNQARARIEREQKLLDDLVAAVREATMPAGTTTPGGLRIRPR